MEDDIKKCLQGMDFLRDWDTWKNTLKESIAKARSLGMSDEAIKNLSVKMGDLLATKICPATKEEELLKEMWKVADSTERKSIASMMFKMVQ